MPNLNKTCKICSGARAVAEDKTTKRGVEFTLHCTVEFKMEKFAQIVFFSFFKNGIEWESQFVISVYQLAALVGMMCPFRQDFVKFLNGKGGPSSFKDGVLSKS